MPDHTNDQHVADDGQDEEQTVDHRRVLLCKTVDVLLLAGYVDDVGGGSEIFIVIIELLRQRKRFEFYSRKKNGISQSWFLIRVE